MWRRRVRLLIRRLRREIAVWLRVGVRGELMRVLVWREGRGELIRLWRVRRWRRRRLLGRVVVRLLLLLLRRRAE